MAGRPWSVAGDLSPPPCSNRFAYRRQQRRRRRRYQLAALPFPVLVVFSGGSSAPAAAITEISWKALRCNFEAGGAIAGMKPTCAAMPPAPACWWRMTT